MRWTTGAGAWALATVIGVNVAAAQTTQPAGSATPPAADGASAGQLLDQMLRPDQPEARPLRPAPSGGPDATSGAGAVVPGAPQVSVLREGTTIVDRIGRLTRTPDGQQWEFSFESDRGALRDPPMVVVPSLLLMQMEDAIGSSRRDLLFRVTGDVTEYRGRNYLLLRKVVVVPEGAREF